MLRYVMLLSALFAAAAVSAEVKLVEQGQPWAEIVIGSETRAPRFAADELVAFVKQSTGATLPVVEQATPGKPHVFLGPSPASAAVGVTAEGLDPEGFRLTVIGSDLHIVGDDTQGDPTRFNRTNPVRTGTLSGVYELLERVVGVRFYWHDDLGTIVPSHESLTVPDLELTEGPAWRYRTLPYAPEGQTYELFGRRLRLGLAYNMSHGHNWHSILSPDEYGAEHPEYFAMVDGQRLARHYSGRHGGQVCTTNPDVIRIFAEKAIAYFDQNPNATMFSVSPNDGGGFCECEQCTALDVENWGDERQGKPVMTDRMLTFYNQVAEKVAVKHPDKYLGAYIYSYYVKPPHHTKPHPNLALVFAVNSFGSYGKNWEREKQWIDEWTKLTDNFYQYDIFWLSRWCLGLPSPVTGHGTNKLKHLLDSKMRGGYLYIGSSYEVLGPMHYLAAKMMWDPEADLATLEQEYFSDLYGPAADEVKAWYDLLEQRMQAARLDELKVDDGTPLENSAGLPDNAKITTAAYYPVLDQLNALMAKAAAEPLDDRQRARLDRVMDHHTLIRTTVEAMHGAEQLTQLAQWDPDQVAITRQAIEDRVAVIAKIREYAPSMGESLDQLDRSETARITPAAAAYQMAQRSGPAVIWAIPAESAPEVDGKLDAGWKGVVWRDLIENKTAAAPAGPARAGFVTAGGKLYLFVDGYDEDGTKLMTGAKGKNNTALFSDDNVELFLVPPGGPGYYQVAVGAGGAVYSMRHPTGDAAVKEAWDPTIEAAVATHDHGWRLELSLPLDALEPTPAAGAEGWKVDLFRTRRGSAEPDEYSALAATFGSHHYPEKYGVLRFGQPTSDAGFVNGDLEGIDAARFEKVFRPRGEGGATIELKDDFGYAGKQYILATIPEGEGSYASLTVRSPIKEGVAYRVTVAHRNDPTGVAPGMREEAPVARAIFRDDTGEAVTDTKGYDWAGSPLKLTPGRWRLHAHTFTAPPRSTQLSYTIFLHHPGEYRLDNFRIEPIE